MDEWKKNVDLKLDRILNDIDFIKNRVAIYLGRNEALTYLADETPIFINTDDFGCPLNFINGGLYEEDYFRVLLSFRKPGLPMLDIGANLGVYSLRMANYMRRGNIYSFEPIPRIRNLFSRSVFLNGYTDRIAIYPYALSDKEGEATLSVPCGHAGGASLGGVGGDATGITVDVKRLDDLFPEDFSCGLIKLDVEGHELHVLRGMRNILARSKDAVAVFEKLAVNSGIESDLYEYFQQLGWGIYLIKGRSLLKVDLATFAEVGGYFVATRPSVVDEEGLSRDFFYIFPSDLNVIEGHVNSGLLQIDKMLSAGSVVFHGPYWWLPRGYYRIAINGHVSSAFTLDICERFGYKTGVLELGPGNLTAEFPVARDLIKFELVMRPAHGKRLIANISGIKLERIG